MYKRKPFDKVPPNSEENVQYLENRLSSWIRLGSITDCSSVYPDSADWDGGSQVEVPSADFGTVPIEGTSHIYITPVQTGLQNPMQVQVNWFLMCTCRGRCECLSDETCHIGIEENWQNKLSYKL